MKRQVSEQAAHSLARAHSTEADNKDKWDITEVDIRARSLRGLVVKLFDF